MSPEFSPPRSAPRPESGSVPISLCPGSGQSRSRPWSWCLLTAVLATSGCQSGSSWSRLFVKAPPHSDKATLSILNQGRNKSQPGLPIPTRKAQEEAHSADVAKLLDTAESSMKSYYQDSNNIHLVEAQKQYQAAIKLQSGCSEAHHGLAIVSDLKQDYPNAELHYRAALDSDPNNSQVLGDLGYSYLLQGKLNQSETLLEQAIKADRGNEQAHRNLAYVYGKTGRPELAESTFRKVLNEAEVRQEMAALFPNDPLDHSGRSDRDSNQARTVALRDRIQEARENDMSQMRNSLDAATAQQLTPQQQQAEAFQLQAERDAAQRNSFNPHNNTANAPIVLDTNGQVVRPGSPPWNQPPPAAITAAPGPGFQGSTIYAPTGTPAPNGGRPVQNGFHPSHPNSSTIQVAGHEQPNGRNGSPVERALHQTQGGIDPQTGMPYQHGIQAAGADSLVPQGIPASEAPGSEHYSDPTATPAPLGSRNPGLEEAKRRAAMIGLAGPEMMFPVVNGTQRMAPGTGSALGAEYPPVQRYLPTNAQPHDLQAISQAPPLQMTVQPNQLGQINAPTGPSFIQPNLMPMSPSETPVAPPAWGPGTSYQDQATAAQQIPATTVPRGQTAPAYPHLPTDPGNPAAASTESREMRIQPNPDARRSINTELYQYGEATQGGSPPASGQTAWRSTDSPASGTGTPHPQPATGADLMRSTWNPQTMAPRMMPPPYPDSPATNARPGDSNFSNSGISYPAGMNTPSTSSQLPMNSGANEPAPIYSPGVRVPPPYQPQPGTPAPAASNYGTYDGPRIRPATR